LINRLLRGAFIWRSAAAGCGEQALGEGFWRLVLTDLRPLNSSKMM